MWATSGACYKIITALAVGSELNDAAIRMTGLAETLCSVAGETIVTGDFSAAQNLAWSYECLAAEAWRLAERLREVAP
jgi:hypothetical protein